MTDDFFIRLERQLEAAELRELNRAPALRRLIRARPSVSARRLLSAPLAAAATLAVAALVVVLALQGGVREDELTPGSVREELSYRVPGGDAKHAAHVLRARFTAAGVPATTVTVPARGRLTISAPTAARADVTALTRPGVLEFYDYEPWVVNGDGGLTSPMTRAEAEERAAADPTRRLPNVRLVHDQRGGDRWYIFFGSPALTNEDLASVGPGVDEATGEPNVVIEFTRQGQRAFEALTRGIAHRALARFSDPGEHFVILLDDRIVAPPTLVNPRETPDGIHGSREQIQGGLTSQSARRIAAILTAGPLPAMVRRDEAGGG